MRGISRSHRWLTTCFTLSLAFTAWSAEAKELVVASWGDPMKAEWDKSLHQKFEKLTGAKLVWSAGNSSKTLGKLVAQRDKSDVDLAMLDDGPYFQAAALGICEKLDFAKIPNIKDARPAARDAGEHGLFFAIVGTGLWYNEKIFAEKKWAPPSSWLDVFKPEFNKRIAGRDLASSAGLMTLIALNEISGGKTPDDMEPGFAKMKELAQRVVTFDVWGETPTLIQQEAIVMGHMSNDRIWNLAASGVPIKFVFPREGSYGWREAACIPKGRSKESVDLAYAYINLMLSKEEQENNAKTLGFIPLHKGVTGYGTDEEIRAIKFLDWPKVNAHRGAWIERFHKEVGRR